MPESISAKEFRTKYKKKNGRNANDLTRSVISLLESKGFLAWRNNTMGVFDGKQAAKRISDLSRGKGRLSYSDVFKIIASSYRKSHELKGVSDVVGFCRKTGTAVYVEVKFGKDRLSNEQQWFLRNAARSGAIALIAKDFDQFKSDLEKEIKRIRE
jgi:hypothetical protein